VDVPQQTGQDCALYAIANIEHAVRLYVGLYSDMGNARDTLPTRHLDRSVLHMPAMSKDGVPSWDAAAATKMRHDILLQIAVDAEQRSCNHNVESRKHIKVNNPTYMCSQSCNDVEHNAWAVAVAPPTSNICTETTPHRAYSATVIASEVHEVAMLYATSE
jgi:hypothetical protein